MGISGAECSSRENIKYKAPSGGIFKEIIGRVGYSRAEHCPMGQEMDLDLDLPVSQVFWSRKPIFCKIPTLNP